MAVAGMDQMKAAAGKLLGESRDVGGWNQAVLVHRDQGQRYADRCRVDPVQIDRFRQSAVGHRAHSLAVFRTLIFQIVLGLDAKPVAVRDRLEGDKGAMPVAEAIARLKAEIAAKTVRQVVKTSAGLNPRGEANEY